MKHNVAAFLSLFLSFRLKYSFKGKRPERDRSKTLKCFRFIVRFCNNVQQEFYSLNGPSKLNTEPVEETNMDFLKSCCQEKLIRLKLL